MSRGRFWATALLGAALLAAALAWLFPYGALGVQTPAERQRVWLLSLWTAGVLAICFGGAGLLSSVSAVGFRDVAEFGSVRAALDAKRDARQAGAEFYNFAGWTVSTGVLLVLVYFGAWLILDS